MTISSIAAEPKEASVNHLHTTVLVRLIGLGRSIEFRGSYSSFKSAVYVGFPTLRWRANDKKHAQKQV